MFSLEMVRILKFEKKIFGKPIFYGAESITIVYTIIKKYGLNNPFKSITNIWCTESTNIEEKPFRVLDNKWVQK